MDLEHIQWFPGHMTKAMRMMEENIKLCDGVIFVLDARAPFACRNTVLEKKLANRPFLYVLNKCDLISEKDRDYLVSYFAKEGIKVVTSVGTVAGGCKNIFTAFKELLHEKIERNKAKGINYAVKAMVIGMPNTGKSTLINSLCADKRTITGDRPGVTRGEQWVKLDNGIILLDTPGTLCHSIEVERTALNLAFIGCIRDAVLDTEGLALEFIKIVKEIYPENLRNRYNVTLEEKTPLEIYEAENHDFYQ